MGFFIFLFKIVFKNFNNFFFTFTLRLMKGFFFSWFFAKRLFEFFSIRKEKKRFFWVVVGWFVFELFFFFCYVKNVFLESARFFCFWKLGKSFLIHSYDKNCSSEWRFVSIKSAEQLILLLYAFRFSWFILFHLLPRFMLKMDLVINGNFHFTKSELRYL